MPKIIWKILKYLEIKILLNILSFKEDITKDIIFSNDIKITAYQNVQDEAKTVFRKKWIALKFSIRK